MRLLKICFLFISKWIGLFHLSSFLYRRKLMILCYHGFSYQDEHQFRPSLFIRQSTFEKRLSWIKNKNFTVLTLDEGLKKLSDNSLQRKTIVITIDDGFRSVGELAVPLLNKYEFPATVYVTTYYALKKAPIFRLMVQYIGWKSSFDEKHVANTLATIMGVEMQRPGLMGVVEIAETSCTEPERIMFSMKLADKLGIDYMQVESSGMMSLMNEPELKEIYSPKIDIQLHTHRHCLPFQADAITREIEENRMALKPIVEKELRHLCYPSGIWDVSQWKVLKSLNVLSATTCNPGMNSSDTELLALNRFLDREDFPQIEFEAELYGFKELMRNCRSRLQ